MTTTYEAHLTRSEGWWTVEIRGLPPDMFGITQGRDLKEAEAMARNAIAALLEVPVDQVSVRLVLPERIRADVDAVAEARARREEVAAAEQEALRRAAQDLIDQGVTVRDAGRLLGLSGQRISQLTGRRRAA